MKPRHLIVTRPAQEAGEWVDGLRAAGHQVSLLPLIAIQALDGAEGWPGDGAHASAVMFVSAAAVRTYLSAPGVCEALRLALAQGQTRLWVTGPGTARLLIDAGFTELGVDQPRAADGRFDSEALWAVVRAQVRGEFVLRIVRGRDEAGGDTGRPWLADRARECGARVEECIVYERRLPRWDFDMLALARRATNDGSVWLFSSSRAVANLRALMPGASWGAALALATHPRISQAALEAGFDRVLTSGATLGQVLASIESNNEFGHPITGP